MKILVICAHPDDEVLGFGGMIKKFSESNEIFILIMTNGCDTRYGSEMIDTLQEQTRKAAAILGANQVIFEKLPNQKLDTIPILQVTETIEKYLKLFKPDIVFSHSECDLNLDHKIIFEATATAVRPLPNQMVKAFYTYYVPSSTDWGGLSSQKPFVPNVLLPIDKEIDSKVKALECYRSELRPFPHPRSVEGLRTYSKSWGLSCGISAAEPFILIRSIGIPYIS